MTGTKKCTSAWHANLAFIAETVGTEGHHKRGFHDVVGVVCDIWAIHEEETNEMCMRMKIEA